MSVRLHSELRCCSLNTAAPTACLSLPFRLLLLLCCLLLAAASFLAAVLALLLALHRCCLSSAPLLLPPSASLLLAVASLSDLLLSFRTATSDAMHTEHKGAVSCEQGANLWVRSAMANARVIIISRMNMTIAICSLAVPVCLPALTAVCGRYPRQTRMQKPCLVTIWKRTTIKNTSARLVPWALPSGQR
jgi:hypothetical protein